MYLDGLDTRLVRDVKSGVHTFKASFPWPRKLPSRFSKGHPLAATNTIFVLSGKVGNLGIENSQAKIPKKALLDEAI